MLANSVEAVQLAARQEGLSSMEVGLISRFHYLLV
jgi:hypothetical protein